MYRPKKSKFLELVHTVLSFFIRLIQDVSSSSQLILFYYISLYACVYFLQKELVVEPSPIWNLEADCPLH